MKSTCLVCVARWLFPL